MPLSPRSMVHRWSSILTPFRFLFLFINDGNNVVIINAKARRILGRKRGQTETQLSGKVFDCVHSRSAEGCGRAIHCSGCAIRRSVTTTFETGESQLLVPATLSIANQDQISQAVIAITTVKIGGLIVLHLE